MKIDEKIVKRFEQLIGEMERLLSSPIIEAYYNDYTDDVYQSLTINKQPAIQWRMNSLQILKQLFGDQSHHYVSEFDRSSKFAGSKGDYEYLETSIAILKAAKDDYENGYLFDTRTLIEAEIFDDLLEQSEHLLSQGYFQAAAVIAGCVLEDTLRKLCDKNNITFPKKPTIEPMNVELAKKGIYNQFIKDKVSSIGKLRNHAAHGEWTEFAQKDVEDMIRNVRRFMEDYFS
jgi:HEPN domain